MGKRSRGVILAGTGCLLILVGLGPLIFALWQGFNAEPLSVRVSLKRGEYNSPYFRTYLKGEDQVQLTWWGVNPDPEAYLDLNWKIVDDRGTVLRQGTHRDRLRGANDVILGYYRPGFGQRQKIVLTIHRDIEDPSANAQLDIGQPEIGLDLSYAFPLFLGWAGIVGGSGVILLCILLIRRVTRKNASPALP